MHIKKIIMVLGILLLVSHSLTAAPMIPTGLSLKAGDRSIQVSWNANSDIVSGYYIYYGTSSDNLGSTLNINDRSATSYTITGLNPAQVYYAAIAAYDNLSVSGRTSVQSVVTNDETQTINAPSGFYVESLAHITETSVSLIWNSSTAPDLSYYKLYYGLTSGSYSSFVEINDKNATAYTLEGLTPASRYFVRLCAVDTSGNQSESSREIIVDTLIDERPPYIPTNPSVNISGINRVTFSFSSNNANMVDFSGFIIYYWDQANPQDKTAVDIKDRLSYTVTDLQRGKTMVFAVSAYDHYGNESQLTQGQTVIIESVHSLLSNEDEFSGGCYLNALTETADMKIGFWWILGIGLAMILMINTPKRRLLLLTALTMFYAADSFASASTEKPAADPDYNNSVGVILGYFYPQEKKHRDIYDKNSFPVSVFYERKLFSVVSADVSIGYLQRTGKAYSDSGQKTNIETSFKLVPLNASIMCDFKLKPLIALYIGAGIDYWYYRETTDYETYDAKDDDKYGVSGYHGKTGLKLFTADKEYYQRFAFLMEIRYSRIDRFDQNKLNLGGWTFNLGARYSF